MSSLSGNPAVRGEKRRPSRRSRMSRSAVVRALRLACLLRSPLPRRRQPPRRQGPALPWRARLAHTVELERPLDAVGVACGIQGRLRWADDPGDPARGLGGHPHCCYLWGSLGPESLKPKLRASPHVCGGVVFSRSVCWYWWQLLRLASCAKCQRWSTWQATESLNASGFDVVMKDSCKIWPMLC